MRRGVSKGIAQLMELEEAVEPQTMSVGEIQPNPRQPRAFFDEEALNELASSIKSKGILQPLIVRRLKSGTIELVAGERRLRAATLAGLDSVPVIVLDIDERGAAEVAIIENVQRENITSLEAARAYRRLIDEFNLTQEKVADKVGKSRVAVANLVRLLKLPAPILAGLEKGDLTEGHARALLQVEDEALQIALFHRIVDRGLTVRDVETLARGGNQPQKKSTKKSTHGAEYDPNWRALEDGMSTYFGSPVKLQKAEVGGKITIDFYSDDDLERILEVLGITL